MFSFPFSAHLVAQEAARTAAPLLDLTDPLVQENLQQTWEAGLYLE